MANSNEWVDDFFNRETAGRETSSNNKKSGGLLGGGDKGGGRGGGGGSRFYNSSAPALPNDSKKIKRSWTISSKEYNTSDQ